MFRACVITDVRGRMERPKKNKQTRMIDGCEGTKVWSETRAAEGMQTEEV